MTAYTTVPNSDIDQDSPVSQPLMQALRDNPLAMFEGASGAPRLARQALGGLFVGDIASTTTTWAGLTGLGAFTEINLQFSSGPAGSSIAAHGVQIRFTSDGGSTWGATQTLITHTPSIQSAQSLIGSATINLQTGARSAQALYTDVGSTTTTVSSVLSNAALTVPANCNGFQIRGILSSTTSAQAFVFGGRT